MPKEPQKNKLPEVLRVTLPETGQKVRYRLAVMRLYNKDQFGRPKEGVFIHNEESVVLEGHEHFITCYVKDGLDYADDKALPVIEES